MAGDLPGYEEALRDLYAGDITGFINQTETWPEDIAAVANELARACV